MIYEFLRKLQKTFSKTLNMSKNPRLTCNKEAFKHRPSSELHCRRVGRKTLPEIQPCIKIQSKKYRNQTFDLPRHSTRPALYRMIKNPNTMITKSQGHGSLSKGRGVFVLYLDKNSLWSFFPFSSCLLGKLENVCLPGMFTVGHNKVLNCTFH